MLNFLMDFLDVMATYNPAQLSALLKVCVVVSLLSMVIGVIVWMTYGQCLQMVLGLSLFLCLVAGGVYFAWNAVATRRAVIVAAPAVSPGEAAASADGVVVNKPPAPPSKYAGAWWE